MPRRWLSVKQGKETSQTSSGDINADNEFVFVFRAECGLQERTDEGLELRPTTSGGERYRSKRKPDLSLLIERPKSSDSVLHKTPRSARFRDSQIGVALGSPHHPPRAVTDIDAAMSPEQQHHAFTSQGPLPATQNTKPRKWKLGGLFRSKSTVSKENFYNVKVISPEAKKLGLPIHSTRTPWRNPKSPLVVQNDFESPPPMPVLKDSLNVSEHDAKIVGDQTHAVIPTLEVSIPGTPLERYSVMFKDVNGVQQSRLLIRRSKGLNQLVIAEETREQLQVPSLTRRATSPTTSSPSNTSNICGHGSNNPKYSLFPTTPTLCITQAARDSPGSLRNRSATAPSLSCNTEAPAKATATCTSQTDAAQSQDKQSGMLAKPITLRTASQDSRGSSQSEIFFDIKSFRDSKGQEGHQFVRPPSAVVQVARTKSNARKLKQKQQDGVRPEMLVDIERDVKTTSVEIDETIALVESLTSPSTIKTDTAISLHGQDSTQTTLQCLPKTQYKAPSARTDGRRKDSSKSRIENLNIDVPSPVLESTEELTPRIAQPSVRFRQSEPSADVVKVTATVAQDSPVIPPSPPRPTPPVKDHKHIPLSKYAPKSTTAELINQVGLRPVRPGRSNTETGQMYQDCSTSVQRPQHPTRSATEPPLPAQSCASRVPHSKYSISQTIVAESVTTEKTMPTMVAYVKPAAEVSIARTVSLSRKPSAAARVTVTALARAPSAKVKPPIAGRQPAPLERSLDLDNKLDVVRVDSLSKKHERVKETVEEYKKEVNLGTPVVQQVHSRHKPGRSMDVVLETADSDMVVPPMPSTSPPPIPISSPSMFEVRMASQAVACS